jgi:hypothetical protein
LTAILEGDLDEVLDAVHSRIAEIEMKETSE